MLKIPKPIIKAKDVFQDCISTVSNAQKKKEYADCANTIEIAEKDFDTKFPIHEIHKISQNPIVHGTIDKKEMAKVYDYRMVKSTMPGNKHYNYLKSSSPYGKCPLCSVRYADTLDHYLPKSKYPVFAVVPINLIPSCTQCNKGKLVSFPTNSTNQTLHPYYDDVENESWIEATVLQTKPISFDYFVKCPNSWQKVKIDRVENHFYAFELNALFSTHANEELSGIIWHLQKLFNEDPQSLTRHLRDAYSSHLKKRINSWQTIMYFSLLNDNWFINGGVLKYW